MNRAKSAVQAYLLDLKGLAPFWRFVLFGYLISLGSVIGQTFFFSLFNSQIRDSFSLSHGQFGLYYLYGTLASALVVAYVGQFLDRLRLQVWTLLILFCLLLASLIFVTATSWIALTAGIFLLRLFGQGMMSHTSSASMARHFRRYRGRALALAGFGEPTYTTLLPVPIALALTLYDWRWVWIIFACFLCLALATSVPLLLGKARIFGELALAQYQSKDAEMTNPGQDISPALGGLTRSQMLKTRRFKLLVPLVITPSFVTTGIIFHHQHLGAEQDWTYISMVFPLYAFSAIFFSLILGGLVDRFTAKRLLWLPLLPMTVACLLLGFLPFHAAPYLAFVFLGITSAGMGTIVAAVWAEMFGPKHLGAIRALSMSMTVFGSALAPLVMGYLFDLGWSAAQVCLLVGFIAFVALISGLILTRLEAKLKWEQPFDT